MPLAFLNREVETRHAAALILGGAALASKLLGLFRDRLLAARFGAGDQLDAYYAAFQIPDLLYTLLLVGAASAAVLPAFMAYEREGRGRVEVFLSSLLTAFSAAALLLAGLAALLAPWLVPLAAPGFGPEKLALAVHLTRLMVASPLLLGVAGIFSAVLQARHRFFVFALPPIFYNLGIIAGILALVPLVGLAGLAYGVLLGGVMQVAIQIPAIRGLRLHLRPRLDLGEPGLRRVIATSLPRVAALGMSQVTALALGAVASLFAAGSLSVWKLGLNLLYVPVGLFGVSWALAAFPKLSSASLAQAGQSFAAELTLGIRNILFWAAPFATLFVVLRAQIVRAFLGSGAFDWEDTRLVAAVLALLAAAVVSESLLPLFLRAFYALGRTAAPLLWDVVGSLLTVGLALGFMALAAGRPELLSALATLLRIGDLASPKILAVALAFAIGSLVNALLLAFALRRAAREELAAVPSLAGEALASFGGAAVLAGLAAYGVLLPFPALVPTNTLPGIALQGLTAGLAGFAVYAAALAWQKNPEILALWASIRARLISPARTPEVFETEKLNGEGMR